MSQTTEVLKSKVISATQSLGLYELLCRVHQRVAPVGRRNHLDDVHQRLLMAFGLASNSNCVDIGAHRGDLLSEIVRCAPDGQHFAFEPLPEQAEMLRKKFPDVTVHEMALSDKAGVASFIHVKTSPQMSGLRERSYGGPQQLEKIDVKVGCLDEMLPKDYVPSLIKIDVEGAELSVLRGATQTLRRNKPILVFEHGAASAEYYGDNSSADIHDLLVEDVGLRIFDIDGNGPYSKSEFEAMFDQALWVWVARN